ncbi:hypothetical protein HRR83_006539 [Exophiala dermatitidis]|uniref:DUF6536 domain-containing protein n=2 Tax=Exophiala dermatitidis TaxID=5970 RepID=H6BWM8_EXODN|nr:uncharacterized protein HMPREF1120_04189 [Exophiala dermatitidis NIH/UT8656]KAJ4514041.1 hypothetical protein HRR74_005699 [Exophiala dermatitidis]EHY56089.1 hypothetical protein HMPREF1120_04189 [Exophiala dermatitidis NIH/UT8656]KAJ4535886.1 hypothetical protein HRR78_008703 [Exophiala dermatitidis]KAJ4536465.1 hypothetical protein HRR77_007383 [Exophiala dermatitidis]KAJ4541006.1 hypothetical protein HRR76_004387 [Exophiala dermatitidis]
MQISRPRSTYKRANTSETASDSTLGTELLFVDTTVSNFKSGFSATIEPEALLLDSSKNPVRSEAEHEGRWELSILRGWPRLHGWRAGALIAAVFALISLLINVVALIWLSTRKKRNGIVELYNGSCGKAESMDLWVHIAINALSTLLLGGSNYCMQCLSSPTRKDVDTAHAKGNWLDIGVPSIRNLLSIPTYKLVLWLVLGFSSVPLHLMYNSAFYKSLTTNDYNVYIVSQDFVDGSAFNMTENASPHLPYARQHDFKIDIAGIQNGTKTPGLYEQLQKADCIRAYATDFVTNRRNLLMVTKHDPSVTTLFDIIPYTFSVFDDLYTWICMSDDAMFAEIEAAFPNQPIGAVCAKRISKMVALADQWRPYGHDVQYCLSERVPESCSYSANIPIVAAVIVANLVKVLVMTFVAFWLRDDPFITIGDAVESFLNRPDRTTEGLCLLTKDDVRRLSRMHKGWNDESISREAKVARLRPVRWAKSASRTRWALTIVGILVPLFVGVGVPLGFAIVNVRKSGFTIQDVGFGKVSAVGVIKGWYIGWSGNPAHDVSLMVLIANLPQTIFSFLYLNLNGLLTSMWLASEWSGFATERKPLRVSKPKGAQRSTHFLQLPYKIALPMMIVAGFLHWMISQALFLVVVRQYNATGTLYSPIAVVSCGFSPIAMIVVMVAGAAIIIATIVLGCARHYNPMMPLAGSCSAAISAACHQPDWDDNAAVKAVQWGVVPDTIVGPHAVGHCSFTSGIVSPIQDGQKYAGLTMKRRNGRRSKGPSVFAEGLRAFRFKTKQSA